MKRLWERVKRLKPYRANERYNEVRGNVLSAGVAYYAFFSVFPAFAIAAVVFGFVLRGTGTFRPVSDVVFVQVARGIAACEQLEQAIGKGRWGAELAFPYHPHVTVAHDVPTDMLDMASAGLADLHAEFLVSSFTEFEQLPDGAWVVAQEYPLTARPA